MRLVVLCLLAFFVRPAYAVELQGTFAQGGLIVGKTVPGAAVTLDGKTVRVSPDGTFVFGFGRDAPKAAKLRVERPDGTVEMQTLEIAKREYRIQRIEGLPKKMVTPPPEVLARIKREAAEVAAVRARDSEAVHFLGPWRRPAPGTVTGVYGSQRILNGKPRRPHFGIDFAAPAGTPVVAPEAGTIVLARPDMYFTGGTIILDHGHGLTSAFLHMSKLFVKEGDIVDRGQKIGAVGATGRATGPHLDWRINWFDRRLDPAFLLSEKDRK